MSVTELSIKSTAAVTLNELTSRTHKHDNLHEFNKKNWIDDE